MEKWEGQCWICVGIVAGVIWIKMLSKESIILEDAQKEVSVKI